MSEIHHSSINNQASPHGMFTVVGVGASAGRLEAGIPVIVYTTSRDVRDSVELKRLGAVHFLSKPVLPDDVYYMLSVVLGESWS